MTFTMSSLSRSLADYLAPILLNVEFYEDPNQQDTVCPCMFLQQRYSKISLKQAGRFLRTIGVDLTYLEDYNLPNLQRLYEGVSEKLDLCLETFTYTVGEDSTLLRAYERNAKIDLDALHYNFELRIWVKPVWTGTPMQTMTYQEEILYG